VPGLSARAIPSISIIWADHLDYLGQHLGYLGQHLAGIWNLSGGHLGLSARTSGICLAGIWPIHGPMLKSQRQNK
jgi:hypothetical protein